MGDLDPQYMIPWVYLSPNPNDISIGSAVLGHRL